MGRRQGLPTSSSYRQRLVSTSGVGSAGSLSDDRTDSRWSSLCAKTETIIIIIITIIIIIIFISMPTIY